MSRLRGHKKRKKNKKIETKYRKRCWIISGHVINDTRQWRLWVRVGFSERHLGQILSGSGTKSRGEEKRYEFSRHRGSARWAITVRSRTMVGHRGRKMCLREGPRARLVSTSLCSRIVRDRHRDGPVIVEKIVLRLANWYNCTIE